MGKNDLTTERLRSVLHYDPATGVFTWKAARSPRNKVGGVAGYIRPDGYRAVCIGQFKYLAHRLAWFYVNGVWPTELIDHRNGVKDDNRIENLREANRPQNMANSSRRRARDLPVGVRQSPGGRYNALITVDRKALYLGTFDTPDEAHRAYLTALSARYGEYARLHP